MNVNLMFPITTRKAKKIIAKYDRAIVDDSWKIIPDELKVSFVKIHDKNGKSFIKGSYRELSKYFKIKKMLPWSPEFFNFKDATAGEYNHVDNLIKFSEKFVKRCSKSEQINTVAHELDHAKKSIWLIRDPEVGVTGYSDILANNVMKNSFSDQSNFKDTKKYKELSESGQLENYLLGKLKRLKLSMRSKVNNGFYKAIDMPKVSHPKEEIVKLKDAFESYVGYIDTESFDESKYYDNFLELSADKAGQKIEDLFSMFEKFYKGTSIK